MALRSPILRAWWPATQAFDLVEAPAARAAEAVEAEVRRFAAGEPVEAAWRRFENLADAFGSAPDFANVPTYLLVLPARGRWSVLWNNAFLCDGYDALAWCLTQNHGLRTLHVSAHDTLTTFQPGAAFCHRVRENGALVERSVQCAQEDTRWTFRQSGPPLPEEDLAGYAAQRKRDRLNETRLHALLERLGAAPWSEDAYALPAEPAFCLRRTRPPAAEQRKPAAEVLRPE